jgi:hypothetical protein
MENTQEPPFGTPEYETLGLERIVSTAGEGHEGVSTFLTATVTFAGDGDMVQEAGVFQRAADNFKAHPELAVTAANWTPSQVMTRTSGTPSCCPWSRQRGSVLTTPAASTRRRSGR